MPTLAPQATSGATSTCTIADDAASWMPPANSSSTSPAGTVFFASSAVSLSTIALQSTKLESGPMWPPHSRPSKMKRRAPSCRNRGIRFAEGTWRKVGTPAASSRTAWSGRPPAMIA